MSDHTRRHSPWRIAVRVAATLVALGLLAWVVSLVLAPDNKEAIERLRQAPPRYGAWLLALSLASLLLNGTTFWIALRPIKKVAYIDMQATHAVAALLFYLPVKVSVLWRLFVHKRRDGLAMLTTGGYLVANGIILLAVLVPMGLVGWWRKGVDWVYVAASMGGVAACAGGAHGFARVFAGPDGLARMRRLGGALRLSLLDRLLHSHFFSRLHRALAVLADPVTVAGAACTRVADVLVQAGRFVVAAGAVGAALSFEKAVLAATSFFLLGIASPAGALGLREGGTTGLAAVTDLSGLSKHTFAVVALTVSATEIVVFLACALVALVRLRSVWTGSEIKRERHEGTTEQ
jgi:hypothetical protein